MRPGILNLQGLAVVTLVCVLANIAIADNASVQREGEVQSQDSLVHAERSAARVRASADEPLSTDQIRAIIEAQESISQPKLYFGKDEGPAETHSKLAALKLGPERTAIEESVRHFHQEGLPLARLWRSDSSALSIGLNPKGKPGLWFVKRLP